MRAPTSMLLVILATAAVFLGDHVAAPRPTTAQTTYEQKVERTWVVRAQRPYGLSSVSLQAAPSNDTNVARVVILAEMVFPAGEEPKEVHVAASTVRVVAAGSSWAMKDDVVPVLPGALVKLTYDVPSEITKTTITISQATPAKAP